MPLNLKMAILRFVCVAAVLLGAAAQETATAERPAPDAAASLEEVAKLQQQEAVLRAQQFEQLTDLADTLLRLGRYDIYSERKGTLMEEARRASAAASADTTIGDRI